MGDRPGGEPPKFLQKLGVKISGIGTTKLVVQGKAQFNLDTEYYLSEDPIEAMSFIAAALVTKSEMTILRAQIEFLEIELEVLKNMNAKITKSPEYYSLNKQTRLVDLTIKKFVGSCGCGASLNHNSRHVRSSERRKMSIKFSLWRIRVTVKLQVWRGSRRKKLVRR